VTSTWSPGAAKRWLRGQRAAQRRIEAERVRALLNRTPEESWDMYLSLLQGAGAQGQAPSEPSPVLWAMRRAVQALARRQSGAP